MNMYDTPTTDHSHRTRDMPCPVCGHCLHPYLRCSDACDCEPVRLPGSAA